LRGPHSILLARFPDHLRSFSEFWFADELQVYLLGLKYFTTGLWPYFGPDVVYSKSQIPGALQGCWWGSVFSSALCLSAGDLLNLLSFSSLASLAWYLTGVLPNCHDGLSGYGRSPVHGRWFIAPGGKSFLHVAVAIFFFLAIFEIYPIYREKIIPERIAFFFVGLSIAAVMQLHMSWVLMIPMALAGFFFQYRGTVGVCSPWLLIVFWVP